MLRWHRVKDQCQSVLLILIIVGQAPTALVVGVGRVCLTVFFSCLSFLSSLSFSLGRYRPK